MKTPFQCYWSHCLTNLIFIHIVNISLSIYTVSNTTINQDYIKFDNMNTQAVAHYRQYNIIHCAVPPSNLMLSPCLFQHPAHKIKISVTNEHEILQGVNTVFANKEHHLENDSI